MSYLEVPRPFSPRGHYYSRQQGLAGPSFTLPVFRDEHGRVVARYAAPPEPRQAFVQRQVTLPGFYADPQVQQPAWTQPWGFQQAFASPYSIWGTPWTANPMMAPLPISDFQAPAFNPYSGSYPAPGAAAERF